MFSHQRYEELINKLVKSGLEPTTNWNKKFNENTLLLRHDVDFSVEYAYQLAVIENRLNVHSTYFFMLTSNMYNIFSAHNKKLIKKIINIGHKVSIHFDPDAYESLDFFQYEKKIFEEFIENKVDIASIHRPGPFLNNNNALLLDTPQTYQDIYFKRMMYISDSGGKDVFTAVDQFLKTKRKFGLHLLTHPIWWMQTSTSPTETLNIWRNKNIDFIYSETKKNCKTYKGK